MADPNIQGGIRALVVLQGTTNLPEDVYVNSWAFRQTGAFNFPAIAPVIANGLHAFYAALAAGFLANSTLINRDYEVKLYHLGETVPRTPTTVVKTLPTGAAAQAWPQQVACCLSFYSGKNVPRNRGRVFIGPLGQGIGTIEGGRWKVTTSGFNLLKGAAEALQAHANANGYEWCVLSQTDSQLKRVTAGWIDESFDTIRKRVSPAQARVTWTAPAPP